ncbi:hypothetical protein SNE40_022005 [Patella caerulea]|uniref:RBR-type E3 ubiquitin transferase n=1 Tax=Patella caerulea TaxID=87958 RepID=A0AAN8G1A6_PATCE
MKDHQPTVNASPKATKLSTGTSKSTRDKLTDSDTSGKSKSTKDNPATSESGDEPGTSRSTDDRSETSRPSEMTAGPSKSIDDNTGPFEPTFRDDDSDYWWGDDDDDDDEHDDDDDDDDDDFDESFDLHHPDLHFHLDRSEGVNGTPLFPQSPEEESICDICYDHRTVRKRLCCETRICSQCLNIYLEGQVNDGNVKIGCPDSRCDSYIHRDEILALLPLDLKEKFYRYLVDANKDPCIKTCPRCSHVKRVSMDQLENKIVKKKGLEVMCEKCELQWCFPCQAPWHEMISCKEYRKGDRMLQTWAHQQMNGQLNAQKCPTCKIFIQRVSGCDNMSCSSCHTSFCYRCGKRFRSLKLLGNHFSRFSPLGCKYNLLPNRPGTRRFLRGVVFSGKLLGGAVLASLALAVGAALVGSWFIIVPAVVGYKLHKRRRRRRRQQQTIQNRMLHDHAHDLARNIRDERFEIDPQELDIDVYENLNSTENWTMLTRLEDSQEVEVLVHSSTNAAIASDKTISKDRTENTVVTFTNVREETNEDGYTRVVAHIVAKNADDSDVKNADVKQDLTNQRKLSKDSTSSFKEDKTDIARKLSLNESELIDGENPELSNDTNGCFVNIFSKKWQAHDTLPKTFIASKFKSSTWEKSGKKRDNIDIRTFSNFFANQSEKATTSCDTSAVPECSSSEKEVFKLPTDYVTYL